MTGLGNGGIVQYNGINVGEVEKLSLDKQDPRKVIARIRLQAGTPVKIDTKAKLAFIGLTGVAEIQLSGGLPQSPRLVPTSPVPTTWTRVTARPRRRGPRPPRWSGCATCPAWCRPGGSGPPARRLAPGRRPPARRR